LPKLAALVTRQRAVYEYFADSIERFPSGEEMRALMRQAGLRCEDQIRVQAGIVTMHVAARADRFDPDARPALAPSVRLRDDPVSGEPVLLYPEGFLQLNATSHDILTRCDGVRTMREIVALLAAEYDAAPAEVEGDVAECLRELQARNFIVLSR
jgi:pyrroloquinoline quinone biosynthesis protein D